MKYTDLELVKLIDCVIEDIENKPAIIDNDFSRAFNKGYVAGLKMIKSKIITEVE